MFVRFTADHFRSAMPLASEQTAQELFCEQFNLPPEAMQHNCDGYHNGCLLEFKKSNRTTLNSALFQCIKYLSSFRVQGMPVPANIVLVFPNDKRAYLFKSENYRQYIHKLYNDSASRNIKNFTKNTTDYETIDYNTAEGIKRLTQLLHKNKPQWVKIQIDEHCVVGWAQTFYRLRPQATKEDFLHESDDLFTTHGELREPVVLADYILPYLEVGNQKFKYILDKLNDKMTQKELGTFYTPPLYAKKALELVREAIREVPKGNDYVIIDRCAGSGNLQEAMTDEELSHCILNTYEYFEYLVLRENFGDKVREIISPTTNDDYEAVGKVKGSNALNWTDGVHPVMRQYVDNPKCTVILFENPPYSGVGSSNVFSMKGEKTNWSQCGVTKLCDIKTDVGVVFIQSAFKFFIKKPCDAYIVFSPIKYWKADHAVNKKLIRGFLFNKKHFHATEHTGVTCLCWSSEDHTANELTVEAYDIDTAGQLVADGDVVIKKVYVKVADKLDKTNLPAVVCSFNGYESKIIGDETGQSIASGWVNGYVYSNARLDIGLLRGNSGKTTAFSITKENFMQVLPIIAAKEFLSANVRRDYKGYEVIYLSGDRFGSWFNDSEFLKRCFLYCCLFYHNKNLSFVASDGRFYRNELCFDKDTIASKELTKHTLNRQEQEMLDLWNALLKKSKKTKEYNPRFTYGLYQIEKEINLRNEEKEYIYPDIHNDIQALKVLLKAYYAKYIVKKLFDYELLK